MIAGFLERQDFIRAVYRERSWEDYDKEKRRNNITDLFSKVYDKWGRSGQLTDYLAAAAAPVTLRTIPREQISVNTWTNSRYDDNSLYANDRGDVYYSYNGTLNQLYSGYSLQDPNRYYHLYTAGI